MIDKHLRHTRTLTLHPDVFSGVLTSIPTFLTIPVDITILWYATEGSKLRREGTRKEFRGRSFLTGQILRSPSKHGNNSTILQGIMMYGLRNGRVWTSLYTATCRRVVVGKLFERDIQEKHL